MFLQAEKKKNDAFSVFWEKERFEFEKKIEELFDLKRFPINVADYVNVLKDFKSNTEILEVIEKFKTNNVFNNLVSIHLPTGGGISAEVEHLKEKLKHFFLKKVSDIKEKTIYKTNNNLEDSCNVSFKARLKDILEKSKYDLNCIKTFFIACCKIKSKALDDFWKKTKEIEKFLRETEESGKKKIEITTVEKSIVLHITQKIFFILEFHQILDLCNHIIKLDLLVENEIPNKSFLFLEEIKPKKTHFERLIEKIKENFSEDDFNIVQETFEEKFKLLLNEVLKSYFCLLSAEEKSALQLKITNVGINKIKQETTEKEKKTKKIILIFALGSLLAIVVILTSFLLLKMYKRVQQKK